MSQFNFDDIVIFEDKKYRGEDNLTLSELDEMSMKEEIKEHFPYEIYKTPDNVKEYIEKQKPLRVKIKKCTSNNYWYKNYIGKEFNVFDDGNFGYMREGVFEWIEKQDCVIIKEEEQQDKCKGCKWLSKQYLSNPNLCKCWSCSTDYDMFDPIEKQKPLRVKIKKCSGNYWYNYKLDTEYIVNDFSKEQYKTEIEGKIYCIQKKDCEVIKEEKPLRMKVKLGIPEKLKFECIENDDINSNEHYYNSVKIGNNPKEQSNDWQKLLEEANNILLFSDSYPNSYEAGSVNNKICKLLEVISLMEKEIESQKEKNSSLSFQCGIRDGKLLNQQIEIESRSRVIDKYVKENQQLKEQLKEQLEIITNSKNRGIEIEIELRKQIEKLKKEIENKELLLDVSCKECLKNKQIKIEDDIIEWLKEFAEYKRNDKSKQWDGVRAKRLLQQLTKE